MHGWKIKLLKSANVFIVSYSRRYGAPKEKYIKLILLSATMRLLHCLLENRKQIIKTHLTVYKLELQSDKTVYVVCCINEVVNKNITK